MERLPIEKRRASVRWRGHDYSGGGIYFVTACLHERRNILSSISEKGIRLSEAGKIVEEEWLDITERFVNVETDEYVIMPDHFHGLVRLDWPESEIDRPKLGQIVGSFKSLSAIRINKKANTDGTPVWQRSFYDHVIRNEDDLERSRAYIQANPSRWLAHSAQIAEKPPGRVPN